MTEETADAGGRLVAPIFIAPLIGAIGRCVYMLQQELMKENERKSFFLFFLWGWGWGGGCGVWGMGSQVQMSQSGEGACRG